MAAAFSLDDVPSSARAEFERLRARFRQGLQARWLQIESASTPEACASALHRLAGAAGSLGYGDLGAAARAALVAVEGAEDVHTVASSLRALAACVKCTLDPAAD